MVVFLIHTVHPLLNVRPFCPIPLKNHMQRHIPTCLMAGSYWSGSSAKPREDYSGACSSAFFSGHDIYYKSGPFKIHVIVLSSLCIVWLST